MRHNWCEKQPSIWNHLQLYSRGPSDLRRHTSEGPGACQRKLVTSHQKQRHVNKWWASGFCPGTSLFQVFIWKLQRRLSSFTLQASLPFITTIYEYPSMLLVPWLVRLKYYNKEIGPISKNKLISNVHSFKNPLPQSMSSFWGVRANRINQIAAGCGQGVTSIKGNNCLI